MSDLFYPELNLSTLKNIQIVRQLMLEHPHYFMESPYSGEVENFFNTIFPAKDKKPSEKLSDFEIAADTLDLEGPNKWSNLAKEAAKLYTGLKLVKHDTESPNEQLAYFKTATSLLEKLVGLEERAMGLKKVHEFHSVVMGIMEEILTPTQRTDVMEKLQHSIDQQET